MHSPFALLIRHFFGRFFDNELVSRGTEMQASTAKIMALLASPGLICFWLFPKYTYLSFESAAFEEAQSLTDKLFFLTFSMVVMGFVTILEWDALFPDRGDYSIVLPLPIRLDALFAAKMISLCGLLLLFFVDINAISAISYPFVSIRGSSTPMMISGGFAAHVTSVFAATAFVFLFFVGLQGLLMNALSFRAFKRFSKYVQLVSVLALLAMLLLFFDISALLDSPTGRHLLYFFPPAWFLGLYETLLGQADPLPGSAHIAKMAIGIAAASALLAYAISYKRHVKKSLESEDIFNVEPGLPAALLAAFANRFIVRKPIERGCFYFIAKTILRSRKHWLYLAAYVGVGFAFMLQAVYGALSRPGHGPANEPAPALLSVPLILSFFALSGLRYVFTIPVEIRANWVFQLSEDERREESLSGARKAMLFFGVVPLYAVLAPFWFLLWGWSSACFQVFFGLALSTILIELLMLNFQKIPFTCSYLPGKANVTFLWLFYWLMFSGYAYSMAALEAWILKSAGRELFFCALGACLVIGVTIFRRRMSVAGVTFIYEDELEPAVRTLNLSVPGAW